MNRHMKANRVVPVLVAAWLAGCGMQITHYEPHPGSFYNTFSYLVVNEKSATLEDVRVSVDKTTVPPWLSLDQANVDLGTVPSGERARARFRYDVARTAEEGDVAELRLVVHAGDRVVQEDRITISPVRELPRGYYSR